MSWGWHSGSFDLRSMSSRPKKSLGALGSGLSNSTTAAIPHPKKELRLTFTNCLTSTSIRPIANQNWGHAGNQMWPDSRILEQGPSRRTTTANDNTLNRRTGTSNILDSLRVLRFVPRGVRLQPHRSAPSPLDSERNRQRRR